MVLTDEVVWGYRVRMSAKWTRDTSTTSLLATDVRSGLNNSSSSIAVLQQDETGKRYHWCLGRQSSQLRANSINCADGSLVSSLTPPTGVESRSLDGKGKSSKEEMKPCKKLNVYLIFGFGEELFWKSVIVFTPGNLASEATSMNSRSFYMPKIHIPAESYAFFCLQERFKTLEKLTKA